MTPAKGILVGEAILVTVSLRVLELDRLRQPDPDDVSVVVQQQLVVIYDPVTEVSHLGDRGRTFVSEALAVTTCRDRCKSRLDFFLPTMKGPWKKMICRALRVF